MELSRLKEPFPVSDVKWRVGRSGVRDGTPWATWLAYIDARAGQDRLDEVFGPQGWQTRYDSVVIGTVEDQNCTSNKLGIYCQIGAKIGDEWVWKCDGAPTTDFESFKGGCSDAFRRCCSSGWGIGRYLYRLDEVWTKGTTQYERGLERVKVFDKSTRKSVWAYFDGHPTLPEWALPKEKQ